MAPLAQTLGFGDGEEWIPAFAGTTGVADGCAFAESEALIETVQVLHTRFRGNDDRGAET